MKTTFQKQTPKVLNYRNYKNFDNEKFNIDLVNKFNELNNHDLYGINCDEFENIISTFNRHAPRRKMCLEQTIHLL